MCSNILSKDKKCFFIEDVSQINSYEQLKLYYTVDVVLDSLYFNYFLASYWALSVGNKIKFWFTFCITILIMFIGTPIITLEGKLWRSRLTASLYRELGICGSNSTIYDH